MNNENKNVQEYNPTTGQMQSEAVPVIEPKAQSVPVQASIPVMASAPIVQPVPVQPIVQQVIDSSPHPDSNTKKGFWDRAWNKNKLKKPEFVAVLFLHEKRMAEAMLLKPEKGFFNIKGKTYHERNDCIYTMVGKERYPLAIIKEWAITPEGTQDWDEKEVQEKISLFQDHAIKGIRHAERVRLGERSDFKLNNKAMIGGAIALVILVAFFSGFF